MTDHPDLELSRLQEHGPERSAAVAAAAASLKRDLGVCGDRARAIAGRAIDAALGAARRSRRP